MENKDSIKNANPIQVAGKLFSVIELLAMRGSLSLMEISSTLDINKSTAHRLLASLQYMGYVHQHFENGKYGLTYKIVELSSHILERIDIVQEVRPFLQKLMQQSGETVHFVKLIGANAVYLDKVQNPNNTVQMVSRIGSQIPFYCSGVGKAIASMLPESEVYSLWNQSNILKKTPYTITDYNEFLFTLQKIRQKGYALDNEENETGIRCIAVAFDLPGQNQHFAFSISAPVNRMDNSRILELSNYMIVIKRQILDLIIS